MSRPDKLHTRIWKSQATKAEWMNTASQYMFCIFNSPKTAERTHSASGAFSCTTCRKKKSSISQALPSMKKFIYSIDGPETTIILQKQTTDTGIIDHSRQSMLHP
ncbi:hypothetical protein TSUD_380920 [Trifolium subterraneum]|uniref:Uncharacterized protein n=1 Tax=Trifolium subterraneum TaxID=3900 RepID=A0A2Z6MLP7_TRISU|nr:hypothetical protein TSUD_380920 [Trifolium subterraneum]